MMQLESVLVRARAAALQRAAMALSGRPLPAAVVSADDVPELVQEILDLRHAVAARPFAGELLTLRESVRSELIGMGAEASAALDAVRALHKPETWWEPYEGYGSAYSTRERAIEELDGLDVSVHAVAPAPFQMCTHCKMIEDSPCEGECTSEAGYIEALWPCATAKLLNPAGETKT